MSVLALLAAALPTLAQDLPDAPATVDPDAALLLRPGESVIDIDAAEAEDAAARRRAAPASPDRIEERAADPYPVGDAISPDDPDLSTLPSDAEAQPSAVPALRLRPSSAEVAPIRSVVRPVEAVSRAALPVTGPIPEPRDPEADSRAEYEPLGLRLGGFTIGLTSTSGIGYSDNASGGGRPSAYWNQDGEIALRSDWERHGLDVVVGGGLKRYFDDDVAEEPNADVSVDGRLDLTEVDRLGVSASWQLSTETTSSADAESVSVGSDINTFSGSIGYERSAGLIGLDLKGAVDRTLYEEGEDRDNTALSGSLRLSLDTGALMLPFVEGALFTRLVDERQDESGFRRSSVGGELKGGLAIDSGLLSGEAAVGYAIEDLDDERLPELRGVVAEASIAYVPTPLATLRLSADTIFEPSRLANASGSITHSVDLDLSYELRPYLIVDAGTGFDYQDYTGVAREVATTTFRAGATWKINRTLSLGLAATHEISDSSVAGEDSSETTVEASLTVRR